MRAIAVLVVSAVILVLTHGHGSGVAPVRHDASESIKQYNVACLDYGNLYPCALVR